MSKQGPGSFRYSSVPAVSGTMIGRWNVCMLIAKAYYRITIPNRELEDILATLVERLRRERPKIKI